MTDVEVAEDNFESSLFNNERCDMYMGTYCAPRRRAHLAAVPAAMNYGHSWWGNRKSSYGALLLHQVSFQGHTHLATIHVSYRA